MVGVETTEAKNKATVLDALERMHNGDLAVLDEHPGYAETKRELPRRMTAFPDLTLRVEKVIAEGDTVAFLGWAKGTHLGDFAGVAPTGRPIEYQVVGIDRLENGKIVQHNASPDFLSVLFQLGVLPLNRA